MCAAGRPAACLVSERLPGTRHPLQPVAEQRVGGTDNTTRNAVNLDGWTTTPRPCATTTVASLTTSPGATAAAGTTDSSRHVREERRPALPAVRHPLAFLTFQREGAGGGEAAGREASGVLVKGAQAARQVLVSSVFDKGGPFMDTARVLFGNGVITCSNADHRRQQPVMRPAFPRGAPCARCATRTRLDEDESDALPRGEAGLVSGSADVVG